jgi:hypothetical protein
MSVKRVRFSETDGDSSVVRQNEPEDESELKRKWQKWTGSNSLPGEGSRDAPVYGELNYTGVKKILDYLAGHCGLGAYNSAFLDIGHGRGIVPLSVAHRFPACYAFGVEIDEYRYNISLEYGKDTPNCCFYLNDFSTFLNFIGADIVYAFDRGFERTPGAGPMHAMTRAWNRGDSSARWLVSFRTPKEWTDMGLKKFKMVTKISRLCSRGATASFTAYFYKKV